MWISYSSHAVFHLEDISGRVIIISIIIIIIRELWLNNDKMTVAREDSVSDLQLPVKDQSGYRRQFDGVEVGSNFLHSIN